MMSDLLVTGSHGNVLCQNYCSKEQQSLALSCVYASDLSMMLSFVSFKTGAQESDSAHSNQGRESCFGSKLICSQVDHVIHDKINHQASDWTH